ncbi:MAG: hypothetical protein ACRC8S_08250 [Fimbriiglobus sp.]
MKRFTLLLILGSLLTPALALAQKADNARALVLLMENFQIVEGIFNEDPRGNFIRENSTEVIEGSKVLYIGKSRDHVNKYLMSRASENPKRRPLPSEDFHPEAAKKFTTQIQPILQNQCMSCHAKKDYPGTFKLKYIPIEFADDAATRANLVTTFTHLDKHNPSLSLLLEKTLTAHGTQRKAALDSARHPAFAKLELWAHGMLTPATKPLPDVVPVLVNTAPTTITLTPVAYAKGTPSGKMPVPEKPKTDPFDPAEFNKPKK